MMIPNKRDEEQKELSELREEVRLLRRLAYLRSTMKALGIADEKSDGVDQGVRLLGKR